MDMLYRQKDNFFYKLHPFTLSFYVFTVFVLALLHMNPVYLVPLLMITGVVIVASGNKDPYKGYLRLSLPLIVMLMIINGLFIKAGATVIYRGPVLPVLGRIRITAEALAYGGGMGLRLLIIISAFCLFTYTVQPDRFMKLFGPFGNRTVFLMTLSIRLFPLMVTDYRRIMEVQRCRGVRFNSSRWPERVRNLFPVVSVLLLSSLERSFMQAESMYARGFGSGRRTQYSSELWRRRDSIINILTATALIFGIWLQVAGISAFEYYPRMTSLASVALWPVAVLVLLLSAPVMMDWGWHRWAVFRSRI